MKGARAVAALGAGAILIVIGGCNRSSAGAGASADRASAGGSGGYASAGYGPSSYGRDAGGGAGRSGDRGYASGSGGGYGEARDDRPPVPMFHGEPMWSQNRAHTAQENAEYHFERAGADLGAKTLDDFLLKAHRFCDNPPAGAQKLTRANGDRLLFDPQSGIFAVATRDRAPRTIFKPSDGMAYWNEQKAREAEGGGEGGGGGYRRSYHRRDDEGYGRSSAGYQSGGGGYGRDDRGGDQG